MSFRTDTEIIALVLTVIVHIIGAGALIWGMIDPDDPDRGSWRDWWPRDDRGDDPGPVAPDPVPDGGGLPVPVADPVPLLDESAPARHRRRDDTPVPSRRPARRPEHPPVPAKPAPDRERA